MTQIVRIRTVPTHTFEETGIVGASPRIQQGISSMDFALPKQVNAKLADFNVFVEGGIAPLQGEPVQFFDRWREFARTDPDSDGRPRSGWCSTCPASLQVRRRNDRRA